MAEGIRIRQYVSMPYRRWVALFGALALFSLAGCAPGAAPTVNAAGDGAGFWLGLWHGFIVPVTLVISLFSDTVSMYEVNNSGNWYDVGFFLGIATLLGGGAAGGSRGRDHASNPMQLPPRP